MSQQRAHSPLGASSAERWMNCVGSVALLKQLKLPESDEPEYRTEGISAHELGAACLREGTTESWEKIGTAYNGIVVDDEMAKAVQVYLDIANALRRIYPGAKIYIEEWLSQPQYHPDMYGTVDFGVVTGDLLDVTDYKHGIGVSVDVVWNPQLMYYAFMLLVRHPEVKRVRLRIVQPRGFHPEGVIREWEIGADELRLWALETLVPAMEAAAIGGEYSAGPWCRFCPAKIICPLLTSLAKAAATYDAKAVIELNGSVLGMSYVQAQAVKKYLDALDKEVLRRLMAGQKIPGTKLVEKKANRVWKEGALAQFKSRFGDAAFAPAEFLSPAAMEKIDVTAPELVKEFAYTPKTGYTVATTDDPRGEVEVKTSAAVFGDAAAKLGETNG